MYTNAISVKNNSLFDKIKALLRSFAISLGAIYPVDPAKYPRRVRYYREPLNMSAVRRTSAERYLDGIAAAVLFELPSGVVPMSLKREEKKEKLSTMVRWAADDSYVFLRRHKWKVIFATLMLLVAIGGVAAYEMFFSNNTFIDDETITGNITIVDRLETDENMREDVVYVLLVGVDDSSLLTDCIWLMCYDIKGNQANVLQIPRDTYVGSESVTGKINNVYSRPKTVKWCDSCDYSPDSSEISNGKHTVCGTKLTNKKESNISALIRCINQHLGLPVDHYVIFNFAGFAKIVDAMGGVEITLETGIHDSAITLEPGTHLLSGWEAVDYMRHRKSYAQGDIGRVSGQRILINAMLNQVLDMEVSEMLSLVTKCIGCFQTDLSLNEIKNYALLARSLSTESFEMFTLPGTDYWDRTVANSQSYYLCNEAEAVALINEYMLPYGLPNGGYATIDTVNFPAVQKSSTASSTTTGNSASKSSSTSSTDEGSLTTTTTTMTGESTTTSTDITDTSTTTTTSSTTTTTTESSSTSSTTTTTTTTVTTTSTTLPIPDEEGEAVG